MATSTIAPNRRYVLKQPLGRGGMGVVYRAYDNDTRRDVALKTILDASNLAMLELFRKECELLSHINHPNIVDIYDVGISQEGERPYFVMPLLRGVTLDKLIADGSQRLTVERTVDIITQACRGLQAAHERGLVHRDVKPSNLFILEDDSVKIIDFGVAHLAAGGTETAVKGTLPYMAPEQLQMKRPTPASDLFSLAVVCYEALTRQRPFTGANSEELIQSILDRIPAPASDLNHSVNRAVSQVVHKAMAKQAFHRFSSVREFAENLQKAVRDEPIEIFEESRVLSRLERARKALGTGELDFASEVLGGLEAEGYIHSEMAPLRRQIDQARRDKSIGQLLENARRCFREEEHQLALQKIQEILQIEPHNTDAFALKAEVENKRSSEQIGKWLALARQHLENHSYSHARQALEDVLQLKPDESTARRMLADLKIREQEYVRIRKRKEDLYQAAQEAWRKGEVSAALSELRQVLELDRKAPDTTNPERAAGYQRFYNQVRSDHDALKNAYDEARRQLNQHNFKAALALCDEWLAKYSGHALFQALKVDVEEAQRQDLSAFIARIDREADAEPDLDRRVSILTEALAARPGEAHFERALQLTTAKRELVNSIVVKARNYEDRRQFAEALNQWEMLRTIYASYPGLEFEMERIVKRRDQQARTEAKGRWVEQIDHCLGMGEWQRALDLTRGALGEFPDDAELKPLEQLATRGLQRAAEAQEHFEQGTSASGAGRVGEGVELLRHALELDERDGRIRAALLDALLKQARASIEKAPEEASRLVDEALELEPASALGKSLRALIEDRDRHQFVDQYLAQARQQQASGDLDGATAMVEEALHRFPNESRLVQLKNSLERALTDKRKQSSRRRDLEEARGVEAKAETVADTGALTAMLNQTMTIAGRHAGDREFQSIVLFLRDRLAAAETPPAPAAPVEEPAKVREAQPPQASSMFAAAPLEAPAPPVTEAPVLAAVPVATTKSSGVVAVPPPPDVPAGSKRRSAWIYAAVGASVVLAGAVVGWLLKPPPPPPPILVNVEFKSEPSGATVSIDSNSVGRTPLHRAVPKGNHKVLLTLDGYKPVEHEWSINQNFTWNQVDRLQPYLASVGVGAGVQGFTVKLDGAERPAAPDIAWPDVTLTAQHSIEIASKAGTTLISFKAEPASVPVFEVTAPPKGVNLYVIGVMGGKARLYASAPTNVRLDGDSTPKLAGTDGLDLENLPASGTLKLEAGPQRNFELPIPSGSGPRLGVLLIVPPLTVEMGGLDLDVNESAFELWIDKKQYRYQPVKERYVVYNLAAGPHKVEVRKDGYATEPAGPVDVQVFAKQAAKGKFTLTPKPTTLTLQGGLPETLVFLDNVPIGRLGGKDGIKQRPIQLGPHTLELRKKGYISRTRPLNVALGTQFDFGPEITTLDPQTRLVRFDVVSPTKGVRLHMTRSGGDVPYIGPFDYPELPPSLQLPDGHFTLFFSADGYEGDAATTSFGEFPITVKVNLKKRR